MAIFSGKLRFEWPLLCSLGMLGVLSGLSVRSTPASQASGLQAGGITLRVDVELITVEVTVLDKKGHPVRNLPRERFQLSEDGKRQEIVTFAEISEDATREAPTSLADIDESGLMRGKVVLILFDDSHITPAQLNIARQSAEKYVKEQMWPVDLFGVASYGMSLRILQNFTHDAAKVVEAIQKPATSFADPSRDPFTASFPGAEDPTGRPSKKSSRSNTESQATKFRVASLFRALSGLNSSIAPIKGRKIVLLYSEDFSATSDVQTEYGYTMDSAKRANVSFYTIDVRGLNAAPAGGASELLEDSGRRSSRGLVRAASSGKSLLDRLRSVSALGSLAMQMSPGNFLQQQGGGGQAGGGQSGSKPSPSTGTGTPSSGTTSPGGSTNPTGSTSGTTTTTPSTSTNVRTGTNTMDRNTNRGDEPDFSQFAEQRIENMLRSLASETGGVAIFNTSDFNSRLNEVSQGLNNYYVLGFQSNNPKRDGKFRRLEVKVDIKGVDLQHRAGYVDPRPLDVLAGSKGEKSMLNAISSPSVAAQLPVALRAGYFYESPGLARVLIAARISTSAIELKNKGGRLAGELNVMGVAVAEDGSISSRFSETLPLLMEKDQEASFRQQGLRYKNHLKLRPGKYQLKFAIADTKGKVGSAEQNLIVPPLAQGALAASSLILAEKANRLPPLIQDLQVKLLDDSDPLIYRGLQIVPSVDCQISVGSAVAVLFKLYNLSGDVEKRNLVAQVQLTNEKGEAQTLPPITIDEHFSPTGKTEGMVGLNLPFSNIAPGKYHLAIAASEGSSNRAVTLAADLQYK